MFTPKRLLMLEGLTVFVAAVVAYVHLRGSGLLFIGLLFVPDISMLGYLANVRIGSYLYNAFHAYALPLILLAVGLATRTDPAVFIALIWFAHIGMDRTVGYGFKYATSFKDTHMQHV